MKKITIGILAHVDAGKTTISESILYTTGAIKELGRVDKQSSFMDTFDLEKERGITIFSKQASFTIDESRYTMIDTPGHVDFSAEMERALQVLDYGILLISASDLVQGHTLTLWNKLKQYEIPTIIFVNKMDQPDNNRTDIFNVLKNELGDTVIDFNDNHLTDDIYEELALLSQDEEVVNTYMESGQLEDIIISELIYDRKVVPVYFGSALKLQGIDIFLHGLDKYSVEPEYNDAFGARVYKISRDNAGNRLTHVKITGGSLKVKDIIDDDQKINQIRIYSGEKYEAVSSVSAGDVCCLIGPDKTYAGQGIGSDYDNDMKLIAPVITYEISFPEDVSPRKIYPDIKKLEEEIPEISVLWNDTNEKIFVKLMGEVQLEIVTRLIKDKLNITPSFDMGQIIYRETICDSVIGVGHFEPLRHYAEVHILIEPLEPGQGIIIDTDCSEDILDKNWQRLIVTHLAEKRHIGVLTGSLLTDVKFTVVNGRAHIKHTEGGDFRQATYRAVRQGLMKATSRLLEPYYDFRISIPSDLIGKVMTDLEALHGKIKPPEINNDKAVIVGIAPVSTLRTYQSKLDSYTHGKGEMNVDFCGYFECHNEDEIIANSSYDPDSDLANPSSSVFCSHGSGQIIPWYEVGNYQHLQDNDNEKNMNTEKVIGIKREKFNYSIGLEEIDEIISKTFSSNANSHKKPYKRRMNNNDYVSDRTKSKKFIPKKGTINLVDGYNVIFAWNELNELSKINIDSAKDKLIQYMSDLQGIIDEKIIIVFDGYKLKGNRGSDEERDNITIVHTKEGVTADNYIEKFVNDNIKDYRLNVYSSDGMIQLISRGIGAFIYSSRELEKIYLEKKEEFRINYLNSSNN